MGRKSDLEVLVELGSVLTSTVQALGKMFLYKMRMAVMSKTSFLFA